MLISDITSWREIIAVIPLPAFVIINAGLLFVVYYLIRRWDPQRQSKDFLDHLSALGLAWLAFSILFELLYSFDALEKAGDAYLFEAFSQGFKNAMALVLIGILFVCLPMIGFVLRKAVKGSR